MGLEPTRPIGHKILSLACLPISALPRDKVYISTAEAGWQQLFSFFFFAPEPLRLPGVGRGQTAYDGVRPLGHSLIILCFCGRLRVLRGELCLTGLDILLNGFLRAFVDGTPLLTAEGLHQAHVVGV